MKGDYRSNSQKQPKLGLSKPSHVSIKDDFKLNQLQIQQNQTLQRQSVSFNNQHDNQKSIKISYSQHQDSEHQLLNSSISEQQDQSEQQIQQQSEQSQQHNLNIPQKTANKIPNKKRKMVSLKEREKIYQQIVQNRSDYLQGKQQQQQNKIIEEIATRQCVFINSLKKWIYQYDSISEIQRIFQQQQIQSKDQHLKIYQITRQIIRSQCKQMQPKKVYSISSAIFTKFQSLLYKIGITNSKTLLKRIVQDNGLQLNEFLKKLRKQPRTSLYSAKSNTKFRVNKTRKRRRKQKQQPQEERSFEEQLSKPERKTRKRKQKDIQLINKVRNTRNNIQQQQYKKVDKIIKNEQEQQQLKFNMKEYYNNIVQRMDQKLQDIKASVDKMFREQMPEIVPGPQLKKIYAKYGKHSLICKCSVNEVKKMPTRNHKIAKKSNQKVHASSKTQLKNQQQQFDPEQFKKNVAKKMDEKLKETCAIIQTIFSNETIQLCLPSCSLLKNIYAKYGNPFF